MCYLCLKFILQKVSPKHSCLKFGPKNNLTMNYSTRNMEIKRTADLYELHSFMNRRIQSSYPNLLDQVIQNGINYLERSYTLHYGWIPETSSSENLDKSKPSVPIIFDTIFILDILSDSGVNLSSEINECATKWIQDNQKKELKVWNFFSRDFYMIPHEPDTTSNAICCLYGLKVLSKEEAISLAENMIPIMWFHEDDGTMDVYFLQDCSYVWPKWTPKKRIDAGVIANVFHCLGRLDMTEILNGPKFNPCFNVLNEVLSEMLNERKSGYLKNYENFDVALLLISRVVQYSGKAKMLFGGKVEALVRDRFGTDEIALHIGCRILAALNLDIVEKFEDLVVKEAKILVSLRDMENGGWPKHAFYSAHGRVYFGSKAVATGFAVAALEKIKRKLPYFSVDINDRVGIVNGKH